MKLNVGIVGGAGYTGGELIRLLLRHPHAALSFIQSRSNAGKEVSSVHHDLFGDTDMKFSADALADADVVFLCAGHGEGRKFLAQYAFSEKTRVIDLSQDFRLAETSLLDNRKFVYGLPELKKEEIRQARNIANPGCFATAIQLSLLPLADAGLLEEVHTTGITGSTGAGQSLSASSHFSWRANNIQAYKTLTHQHLKEIGETLAGMGAQPEIYFVPWRGDFTRGIFTSSMMHCEKPLEELVSLYSNYYHDQPFTHLSRQEIFLKQVVNTNKCLIHLEKVGSKLVVHSAIDNLLKGASGQAVQNMNLMFGLDECAGLNLKATGF